jgi:hypothetical protein
MPTSESGCTGRKPAGLNGVALEKHRTLGLPSTSANSEACKAGNSADPTFLVCQLNPKATWSRTSWATSRPNASTMSSFSIQPTPNRSDSTRSPATAGVQAKDHVTQKGLDDVRRRAQLNKLAPVNTLLKRGIRSGRTLDELEAEVTELLQLPSVDHDASMTLAARRSNSDQPISSVQKVWVACVRQGALKRTGIKRFSVKKLTRLAAQLPALLKNPEQFRELPTLFAVAGVSLVRVGALPGAKIDGCSFVL